jgi:hypothetical protein
LQSRIYWACLRTVLESASYPPRQGWEIVQEKLANDKWNALFVHLYEQYANVKIELFSKNDLKEYCQDIINELLLKTLRYLGIVVKYTEADYSTINYLFWSDIFPVISERHFNKRLPRFLLVEITSVKIMNIQAIYQDMLFKKPIIKQGWQFPVCRSFVMFISFFRGCIAIITFKQYPYLKLYLLRYKAKQKPIKKTQYQSWTLYSKKNKKVSTLFNFL